MSPDPLEILSALMDGEAVAPDVLAAALLAPGAREALVEFAGLRAELAADNSSPSPGLVLSLATLGALSLRARFYGRGPDEPPPATRVIQFTPGVDWHEGGSQ
jgi:hypothetical protein